MFLVLHGLALSPLIFLGAAAALAMALGSLKKSAAALQTKYLLSLSLPLPFFYFLLSLGGETEGNWTAPAIPSLMILSVATWLPLADSSKFWRLCCQAALALGFALAALLHNTEWLGLPRGKDPFDRMRGSKNLAAQIHDLRSQSGASFLIFDKYSYASLAAFYLPTQEQTYLPFSEEVRNQFSFWPQYRDMYREGSALFITDGYRPPESLGAEFETICLLKETWSVHKGRRIRLFRVFFCERLKAVTVSGRD
jgi:hypothetical protein